MTPTTSHTTALYLLVDRSGASLGSLHHGDHHLRPGETLALPGDRIGLVSARHEAAPGSPHRATLELVVFSP